MLLLYYEEEYLSIYIPSYQATTLLLAGYTVATSYYSVRPILEVIQNYHRELSKLTPGTCYFFKSSVV